MVVLRSTFKLTFKTDATTTTTDATLVSVEGDIPLWARACLPAVAIHSPIYLDTMRLAALGIAPRTQLVRDDAMLIDEVADHVAKLARAINSNVVTRGSHLHSRR